MRRALSRTGLLALVLLAAPAAAQTPKSCADDPGYSQQDFTLGAWDVYSGEKKTAEVLMEKRLDGCTIFESWTKPTGQKGNGLGLFTWSTQQKVWHYHWAADNAAMTVFTGTEIKPGEIRYITERKTPSGGTRRRHWSLILMPDGKVRELAVGTEDDGKTWITEYDLTWVRKP